MADPTVNRYLSALSSVFNTAIKNGWFGIKRNPCVGVSRGGERHRFGRSLTKAEITRLLDACDNSESPALPVLIRLALATGARKSELLKLMLIRSASGFILAIPRMAQIELYRSSMRLGMHLWPGPEVTILN